MKLFSAYAISRSGTRWLGTIRARSEEQARANLLARGLGFLFKLVEI